MDPGNQKENCPFMKVCICLNFILMAGKQPISFRVYQFLADEALKASSDFDQAVFAHLFLVLCWNLAGRSNSIGTLQFANLAVKDDAIGITFPTTKTDKTGDNKIERHVYANVVNPSICPYLALGIFVFTAGRRNLYAESLIQLLFGQKNAEARFSKWLNTALKKHQDILEQMGVSPGSIGV